MRNWLLEPAIAIDQKSSDVAITTKQTKSHIKVLPLQPLDARIIRIALGWGKDKDAVWPGSYATPLTFPASNKCAPSPVGTVIGDVASRPERQPSVLVRMLTNTRLRVVTHTRRENCREPCVILGSH